MRKVVFVSHAAGFGGAENFLGMLLAGLDRSRFEPCVLSRPRPFPWTRPAGVEITAKRLGVDFRFVDLKWWARDWRHDAAFARGLGRRVETIASIIREQSPALLVSNTSVVVEGALAARQCGVPHLWYVHEMLSRDPGLDPFLPLAEFYRLMESLSTRIVVVADAVRAEIEQFAPSDKITVRYTGIPPAMPSKLANPKRELFGLTDEEPLAAFVGRLSRRKGVLDLVEAARLLLARRPNVLLVLSGADGGAMGEVAQQIKRYGLGDRVRLLGPRRDVPDILAAADLLVLPALADPLPLAVLEAMSAGKPVVATRSGGCEELIVDGQTGLLVPVSDPPALAAAIQRLADDGALRLAMGRAAKARFEVKFNQQGFLDALCGIFEDAMDHGAPPMEVAQMIRRLETSALARRGEALRAASVRERCMAAAIDLAYRFRAMR